MRTIGFMLMSCLPVAVMAHDSADERKATTRTVLEQVAKLYERECGTPSRCSLTLDARGSCPFEVGVASPRPLHADSSPNQSGSHVFWLCIDKDGTILHRLNGTSRNWPRA